jgi:hypothetical protein
MLVPLLIWRAQAQRSGGHLLLPAVVPFGSGSKTTRPEYIIWYEPPVDRQEEVVNIELPPSNTILKVNSDYMGDRTLFGGKHLVSVKVISSDANAGIDFRINDLTYAVDLNRVESVDIDSTTRVILLGRIDEEYRFRGKSPSGDTFTSLHGTYID